MRIVNLSYVPVTDAKVPRHWLTKISFYTGILECMTRLHEVHSIHCIGHPDVVEQRDVTYHFFKLSFWQRLFPDSLHNYVKKLNPDVVIVHGLHFPWKVLHLKNKLGTSTKIFIQHHAEKPYRDFRRIFQKRADRFVHGYFFASQELANQYLAAGIISSKEKIFEVMEASSDFKADDRKAAKSKLGLDSEIAYMWVGRLDRNKDPLTLLKAFIPFAKENRHVCLNLIFKESSMINDLTKLLSTGPPNIKLIGKVKHGDLQNWFNACDFIISSSHYEGSGISVCEAMSCGCIPIVTKIPSFKMMTANETIGLSFSPGDVSSLSKCLKRSLDMNREVEKSKVLHQFSENLSFEAIAKRMLTALSTTT
jgi:glycosyltransferase involved in cell wall biosynthesis